MIREETNNQTNMGKSDSVNAWSFRRRWMPSQEQKVTTTQVCNGMTDCLVPV